MTHILRLENDLDCSNPLTDCDGQWTLHSFSKRHINFKQPEDVGLGEMTTDGPKILNPGLRSKLRVGLAFFLDYFEHGEGRWSLHGEGMQCHWDTARYGGLLGWEHKPSEMGAKTIEDRAKDARACLDTYNDWCNGHCYGYSLENADGSIIDSCWGFIGTNDLTQAVNEAMAHHGISLATVEGEAAWIAKSNPWTVKQETLTPSEIP